MPSSPGYRRDLKQEYATQKARGEVGGSDSPNSKRKRLRRQAEKAGMVRKGQDLDHIKPLSKGGANTLSNARPAAPSKNRSVARKPDGSLR
ncbi:HNHc domain containing protein [Planktothrix phage Pra-JY27]|nr:CRISPR-associated endonuclease Cas9/Csn1 family [Planktothrix phage Pag-Yong1]WEV89248.1 HNHc domain containing protein [Synechococcus phage MinM2]